MTQFQTKISIFCLIFSIWGGVLFAQNDSLEVAIKSLLPLAEGYQTPGAIVYGSYVPPDIIPAQILRGEELRRLSVSSVADAIRYFSGVQIKDYGGIGGLKTVNIRSMGTHQVGFFYDGIQLGNAQNGQIDLGRFSLDNMESLEIYNGQKSSIFQSARDFAAAGSVYMTTRRPRFEPGKRNNISVTLKGGSFATLSPSVLWERQISQQTSTSFNAEYLESSGKYKFSYRKKDGYDTTELRRNGDIRAWRVENGIFRKIKGGQWHAKVYYYHSERGFPGAAVREEPGKFKHEDRQWDDNIFVQSSLRKQFAPRYSLLVNGKVAYDYLRYLSDPRLDVTTMFVDNRFVQAEVYLSAANQFTLTDIWNVNLASDFQYNSLSANLTDFAYPSRVSVLTALASALRLERVRVQASLLHTYVHDNTRVQLPADLVADKSKLTPTLAVMYRPMSDTDLSFRAFYKRAFRMPTMNDLYYTIVGRKSLKPEETTQYDVGATYRVEFTETALRRVEFEVDGYFNQMNDKIIAMPTSNQFQWTMLNLGYVEIVGVDASAQSVWRLGQFELETKVNYTYQQAQDFTDPTEEWYGGQIPYIPIHGGSLVLNLGHRGWNANYSFIYTGERYASRANIAENYVQPWYTHDISISKTIPLTGCTMRLTAEVNNLLNQQYEVVKWYPMPGTNFKIKLNITL